MTIHPAIAASAFALLVMCPSSSHGEAVRPNILIIMTDDLGFSDLGCYGSEIETPHLDQLASRGVRFSQFYNTAKCHSSRISLLTGRYAFQAGNTSLSRASTSAELLQKAGYFTAMTGKWHLQREPTDFGFERYFGHLSGACNYFRGDKTFRLNGDPWKPPATGFYTTTANVDYALKFLDEARNSDKPWHLYVAFNAPHAPLQPLQSDYEKYKGRYESGWDKVRERRFQKQLKLGLFKPNTQASPRPPHIPAWSDLSAERQRWEARRMTALAAMIDRVDQEVGRLLSDLRDHAELENTLVLFVSDNGACPYDRRSRGREQNPWEPDVSWSDSTGWAWARNTPFRFYKQNQYEGGIATPAIVHWPSGLKTPAGSWIRQPAHLIDVLPTLADLVGRPLPVDWPGRELEPVAGVSLMPLLRNEVLPERPPIHLMFGQDRGLRRGDWKLVSFRGQPWELYNLRSDRTELDNVAKAHPEIVSSMSAEWRRLARDILKAPANARTPVADSAALPHRHPEWTAFDQPLGDTGKKSPGTVGGSKRGIRARKNTRLTIVGQQLHVMVTGEDGGIAMDQLPDLPPGPYLLRFEIQGNAGESGELYFTTRRGMKLPSGEHITFRIPKSDQKQAVKLELKTAKSMRALRLDPGNMPGSVILENLELMNASGKVLLSWP